MRTVIWTVNRVCAGQQFTQLQQHQRPAGSAWELDSSLRSHGNKLSEKKWSGLGTGSAYWSWSWSSRPVTWPWRNRNCRLSEIYTAAINIPRRWGDRYHWSGSDTKLPVWYSPSGFDVSRILFHPSCTFRKWCKFTAGEHSGKALSPMFVALVTNHTMVYFVTNPEKSSLPVRGVMLIAFLCDADSRVHETRSLGLGNEYWTILLITQQSILHRIPKYMHFKRFYSCL